MIAFVLLAFSMPPVEASLLDGRRVAGRLVHATNSAIALQAGDRRVDVSRDELLRLDFQPSTPEKTPIVVRLTDGSRFGARSFESDGRVARTNGPAGELSIPVERLAAVLLVDDPQESADFAAKASEKPKADRIVIAREDKRLALDGIIGKVGSDKIEFTLDGDVLPINRSRGKALYFSQKASPPKPMAMIADRRGDLWAATDWRWGSGVAFQTPTGFERTIAVEELASIDLSAGRVVYLSDLEPRMMQHTPALDHPWPMKLDRGPHGGPLEVGGRSFAKGVVLHSKTIVEHDLDGKYRRFQTVVGIPAAAGPLGDADVRVLVDGKAVWERRLRSGDAPTPLDLPTVGARILRLEVDFGKNLDLGDHVAFADAKVIK
jgi:hypothetical protein